jgi:hypothetical protein
MRRKTSRTRTRGCGGPCGPGYLTIEFLHGRRARYLPPLRLYLVLSVVFFLYASVSHDKLRVLEFNQPEATPKVALTPPKAESGALRTLPGESIEQHEQRLCSNFAYQGPFEQRITAAWRQVCPRLVADGGRSLAAGYLHNLPRAMFVFLPLLAGVMRLMYWRPRHYYIEHLLLLVHNHAFVFLAVLLTWLLSLPLYLHGRDSAGGALLLHRLVHVPLDARRLRSGTPPHRRQVRGTRPLLPIRGRAHDCARRGIQRPNSVKEIQDA